MRKWSNPCFFSMRLSLRSDRRSPKLHLDPQQGHDVQYQHQDYGVDVLVRHFDFWSVRQMGDCAHGLLVRCCPKGSKESQNIAPQVLSFWQFSCPKFPSKQFDGNLTNILRNCKLGFALRIRLPQMRSRLNAILPWPKCECIGHCLLGKSVFTKPIWKMIKDIAKVRIRSLMRRSKRVSIPSGFLLRYFKMRYSMIPDTISKMPLKTIQKKISWYIIGFGLDL